MSRPVKLASDLQPGDRMQIGFGVWQQVVAIDGATGPENVPYFNNRLGIVTTDGSRFTLHKDDLVEVLLPGTAP